MLTKVLRDVGMGKGNRWLEPADWTWAQMNLPIVCVDILPIRCARGEAHQVESIGLIKRITERGSLGWCLVGGRLLLRESLTSAIKRQIKETLGNQVRISLPVDPIPILIAQYAPSGRPPFYLDPRKHSIGITYAVEVKGTANPRGEAVAFQWFRIGELPPPMQFGFNQDRIVKKCLVSLRKSCITGPSIEARKD